MQERQSEPQVGKIPWRREWQLTPVRSWLENPMDRGAWRAIVHGVARSQTPGCKAEHLRAATPEGPAPGIWGWGTYSWVVCASSWTSWSKTTRRLSPCSNSQLSVLNWGPPGEGAELPMWSTAGPREATTETCPPGGEGPGHSPYGRAQGDRASWPPAWLPLMWLLS